MARTYWMYGFIPEAIAVGFAGILTPLFVVINLKGSLLDIGLIAGVSGFALIPSVILWGSLADKLSRCKIFIVLSFTGMGVTFFLTAAVQDVSQLLILTTLRSFFYAASLPTRQILIAESGCRDGWAGGVARLEFLTGVGEATGILLGSVTGSAFGFAALFQICGLLSLTSAAASAVLVREPGLMIERRLLSIERFTNTLTRASTIVCEVDRNPTVNLSHSVSEIFRPSVKLFMLGVFTFALAGKMLFTTLPVYFLNLYSEPLVFPLFFMNSAANTFSYLFVNRLVKNNLKTLILSSALRVLLIPLLLLSTTLDSNRGFTSAAAILILLGVVWALFDVSSTCLYLELSQLGRTGFYSALIGIGSAAGGLLGGYISMFYGFETLFILCSLVYAATLFTFTLQHRRWSRIKV